MRNINKDFYDALTSDHMEWDIDACVAIHKPTGCKFWIANGLLFMKEEEQGISIGLIYTIRLYYWLKNAKKAILLSSYYDKLRKKENENRIRLLRSLAQKA